MHNERDPDKLFGCYLLTSEDPRFQYDTYVGFTVDPVLRLKQHNGEADGGAKKTQLKRPWRMVLMVHGFTSQVAALRFEWAWQHPLTSVAVRDAASDVQKRLGAAEMERVRGKLHVLYEMLGVRPFCRYPLNVTFFARDCLRFLEGCPMLPPHMKVGSGRAEDLVNPRSAALPPPPLDEAGPLLCSVCSDALPSASAVDGPMRCPLKGCRMRCHVVCLAKHWLRDEPDELMPTGGACPGCSEFLTWGNVVADRQRRKKARLIQLNQSM